MDDHITHFDANGNVQIGKDSTPVSRILESNPEDYKRWKAWNTANFGSLRRAANEIGDDLDKLRERIFHLKTTKMPKALNDQVDRIYTDIKTVKNNIPNFNLGSEQDIFNDLIAKIPNIKTRF